MKQVDHPNIVRLRDMFEDEGHYCLVLDLCEGGELFDAIIAQGCLTEGQAHKLMLPIVDAVNYAHSIDIIHRDLKPENILLTSKDLNTATIKISDFGLARFVDPAKHVLASTTCGTPGYVAPEILKSEKYC